MKVTLLAGLWNTSQGQCHLVSGDDVQSMLGDFQLRSAQVHCSESHYSNKAQN